MAASGPTGAGVLLLKERNTSNSSKQDTYEAALTSAGFRCRFVAPLSFAFPEDAQLRLVHTLREGPLLSGTLALVATSPRGVDALVQSMQKAASASEGWSPARLRALWEGRLVFVVGDASATHLRAHDDLAGQCGFRAEVCPSGANAAELGRHLRARSSELFEAATAARHQPAYHDARSAAPLDHLLVLVGDHRREEIFEVLRGQTAEAPAQPIPHTELIVYHTLVAEASSVEAVVDDGPAALNAASPFLKQLLTHLLDLGCSSSPSSPIFIVFFSPSGVDTFFSQLLLAPAPVAKQIAPFVSRFRFACIGQTSAAALAEQRRELPQLDWLRQAPAAVVAAKPNAEEMLRCLQAATEGSSMQSSSSSSPAAAVSPPSMSAFVSIPFFKYHGTLNDYVLLDGFARHYTRNQLAHIARSLCFDRRGAIGSDGLLYVTQGRERLLTSDPQSLLDVDPAKSHIHGRMHMYNTDGSEAEMCGNGLRCVAKFVYDHKSTQQPRPAALNLLTGAGEKTARVVADPTTGLAAQISLDLGRPVMDPSLASVQQLSVHDVSMGNPHCIVLLPASDPSGVLHAPHVDQVDVDRWGKALHDDARYASTNGVNVSFVSIRTNGDAGSRDSSSISSSIASSSASPVPVSPSVLPTGSASVSPPPPAVLTVDIRTYERGNGETWSCGSGISATVSSVLARRVAPIAAASSAFVPVGGYPETVRVFVRGGELSVTCWLKDRPSSSASDFVLRDVLRVQLTGPATEVFEGKFPLQLPA